MNQPIIHTEYYLVSCADVFGFRDIIARIDVVDKPKFPRSGLMDKKGIYEAWNAYKSPFAIWGFIGAKRYYWYSTIEQAMGVLHKTFDYEFDRGAIIMEPREYEQEQIRAREEFNKEQ